MQPRGWAGFRPRAVLFDLDGTLIDSAPDLVAALNVLRARRDLQPGAVDELRALVTRGALGLLSGGLPDWDHLPADERKQLQTQLLDHYEQHCWEHSAPFDGIVELLDALESKAIPAAIVTNKIGRFARPILELSGWTRRFGCLVAGDDVERPKPDPQSVELACRLLDVPPEQTVFIGDDRRDILAGAAAGTRTIAAAWGYISAEEDPRAWGADVVASTPNELFELLIRAGQI